jgi:hypothetical protein
LARALQNVILSVGYLCVRVVRNWAQPYAWYRGKPMCLSALVVVPWRQQQYPSERLDEGNARS